jgi:exonuclease VII small subunit
MKLKNIPADISEKSLIEAQNEIKEIIKILENNETDLDKSMSLYNRMLQLNYHITDQFRKKAKEIKATSSNKDLK